MTLSDENDCSIAEEGSNWMFAQHSGGLQPYLMPRGTAACESDPNSVCCRSCALEETSPPAGCQPLESDASCLLGDHSQESDHLNLRCWEQKRRFGADGLYPTRRYVDGLTGAMVPDRAGKLVANPLFDDGSGVTRALDNVLFVPIVGVPWQDVATDDSLNVSGLTYLSAAEIAEKGRWNWLVPACKSVGANGVCDTWNFGDQPDDPLMIESTAPRTGVNPATGIALAGPDSMTGANPINGHEMNIKGNNDLQYACIFELSEPRDCSKVALGTDCQCDDWQSIKSPLCQQPDGSYGVVQRSAKAYPGTRQLQVAMGVGNNAVVGSICPKSLEPTNSALAYVPVVNAIARQLPGRLVK